MFKVRNKNIRTASLKSFWCTPFPSVSIVDFEQVNISCGNVSV